MEVRLISPQYISPFVKTDKNGVNDAAAIVDAASRPTMRFVPVKSVEQQDMRAVHRVRELLVHHCTALINQVRGLLGERGVIIAQTPAAFKRAIPAALGQCEGDMTSTFQAILIGLLEQMRFLEERIARTNQWIAAFMKHSVLCQKIQAIDGVGPITATAMIAAVGNVKEFRLFHSCSLFLPILLRNFLSKQAQYGFPGRMFLQITEQKII